ncbi:MAG TPA: peptidylprolyl isomerase [Chthoniobacteraceae bacterium]
MKSKGPLAIAIALSVLATPAVQSADPVKKPVSPKNSGEKKATPASQPAAEAAPAKVEAGPAISDPVAVVEGAEIKKADLDAALTAALAQGGRSAADIPPEQKLGAYNMVLEDLIAEKLINKRSADIQITDDEVTATLKRFTGGAPDEQVKEQIEKSGRTMEVVRQDIRQSLRQQRWVEDQVKGKVEVTDAEAEEFYKANQDKFKAPERVRASHILIAVPADAKPEAVVEKEKAAQAIAARVKKGEDFAKLAQELSEDPSAKQNSGDLDFFGKEQMVPEFSEAAWKMKKGDISDPVRSQFGYHIIKVTDRKDPETVDLAKAKPQLMAYLQQQKKQVEVEKLVKGIRAGAEVKVNLPPAPPEPAGGPEAEGAGPASAPKAP